MLNGEVIDVPDYMWRRTSFEYTTKDGKKYVFKRPTLVTKRLLTQYRYRQAWEMISLVPQSEYERAAKELTRMMAENKLGSVSSLTEFLSSESGVIALLHVCSEGALREDEIVQLLLDTERRPENEGLTMVDIAVVCMYCLVGCLLGKDAEQLFRSSLQETAATS